VPDDSAASYNLGNYFMEKRQLPEAVAAFNRAILGQSRSIPSLVNVSMAYSLLGSNMLAEQSLRRALSLQPTNAAVNLNLGLLLAEENKLPEAEQALRTSFRAEPTSAQAAFNLGILLSKDRPEEALTWCRKAVELRPGNFRYAYTLGFFQNQFGQSSAAIATLEKLLEEAPLEPDAYMLLADIYSRSGNAAKALSVLRRAADNARLSQQDRARFRSLMERMSRAKSE
jgi:tetratricopeptide (TPR) repeat protein